MHASVDLWTRMLCVKQCHKKALDFSVVRLLTRFLKTSNIDLVNECRAYFDFELPSELLQKRTVKMMNKYERAGNSWCRYLSQFGVDFK